MRLVRILRYELLKARGTVVWIVVLSASLSIFAYGIPILSEISASSAVMREVTVVSWMYVPTYIAGLGRAAAPILGTVIGISVALNEIRSGTAYSAAVVGHGWPRLALIKMLTSSLVAILSIGAMFTAAYLMCAIGSIVLPIDSGVTPASGASFTRVFTANLLVYTGFLLWAGIGWLVSALTLSTIYSYIVAATWIFAEQFSYYPYLPGSIHAGVTEAWIDYLPDGYTVLWPSVGIAALPIWVLICATILTYAVALSVWVYRHGRLTLGSTS
ncbi:hypothetical protein [Promicromonospora sp. NPDC090134]|uniref:hypothetical protein n=1 Tax=Promicromonospora sp. NPDC090134 TaxID=3364408 RepID=UPI0037FA628C